MPPVDWAGGSDFYQKPAPHDPIKAGVEAGLQVCNAATGMTLYNQSHMPFGQHGGKLMERVPAHYLLDLHTAGMAALDIKFGPVLSYIERHLHEITERSKKEKAPKEPATYLYLPKDMEECAKDWGAACGHGALAACLGTPVSVTLPLLGKGGWINVPMMKDALIKASKRFGVRRDGSWPQRGKAVVMLQWLGSWMEPGVPLGARCAYRHWVAVRDMIITDKRVIWDANSQQWQTLEQWEREILPLVIHPKATGWEVSFALCVWE